VVGVYEPRWVPEIGRVLANLGSLHAFVVHGDGYDEITVTGTTSVSEVKEGGKVEDYEVTPQELGLSQWRREDIKGGEVEDNARILRDVLAGGKGAPRDAVLANAAAALVVAGAATNLRDGVKLAGTSIDSGAARRKLDELAAASVATA
jgi:anthranilate phosphoribosyltransferase